MSHVGVETAVDVLVLSPEIGVRVLVVVVLPRSAVALVLVVRVQAWLAPVAVHRLGLIVAAPGTHVVSLIKVLGPSPEVRRGRVLIEPGIRGRRGDVLGFEEREIDGDDGPIFVEQVSEVFSHLPIS